MGGALTVLLVEDDPGDAFLVQELLRGSETAIEVEWVTSLAAARQRLSGERVHCVLLDLHLPDAVGPAALDQLLVAVRDRVPVIVLTGLADRDRGLAAVATGAADYLLKGQVDGPLLERAIRFAVERERAEEGARRLFQEDLRREANRRLTQGLLPRPLQTTDRVRCDSRYRPAGQQLELGGDFWDLVELEDGHVRFVVGDVCGHGPDQAALGVLVRNAWRTAALAGIGDEQRLAVVERLLVAEAAEATGFDPFVTLCDVTVSPGMDRAVLRVAGHPPPLLVRPGVEPVAIHVRPPLGVSVPGLVASTSSTTVELPRGWALLAYSDGLLESRRHGPLEIEELVEAAKHLLGDDGGRPGDLDRLVDGLVAVAVERNDGALEDDLALLVVSDSRAGSDGRAGSESRAGSQ